MFDENSNGGSNKNGVKLTLKDKRRPTPLDVRLATQRARGEVVGGQSANGALSTPDIVNVTVRSRILIATDCN